MKLSKSLEEKCLSLAEPQPIGKPLIDVLLPAGRGRQPTPGAMNKLEAAYAARLEDLRVLGEIAWWRFEPLKLRLADRTYYSPDFLVMALDGRLEFHETKGWMREDANVKLKVAAEQFPIFKFVLVKQIKGGWDCKEI